MACWPETGTGRRDKDTKVLTRQGIPNQSKTSKKNERPSECPTCRAGRPPTGEETRTSGRGRKTGTRKDRGLRESVKLDAKKTELKEKKKKRGKGGGDRKDGRGTKIKGRGKGSMVAGLRRRPHGNSQKKTGSRQ